MLATMTAYLSGFKENSWRNALRPVLFHLVDRYSSQPLTTAGLVIKAGGSTLAKTGAADFYASVKGILVKIAASTDMTALTGLVISANNFNVACFFVDSAGVVTVAFGTQGATLGAVVFPQFAPGMNNKALIGFLLITHSATFTGGTTALDTATTVYVSPLGPFDPTMLV
jgi:hypothetical protein